MKLSGSSGTNAIKGCFNKEEFIEKPGSFSESSSQERQSTTMILNESRNDDLCSREPLNGEEIYSFNYYKNLKWIFLKILASFSREQMVGIMMCLILKLHVVFTGESDIENHCYKDYIAQKPRILTEKSHKGSHSTISDLTEGRADDVCSTEQVQGEDNTIVE